MLTVQELEKRTNEQLKKDIDWVESEILKMSRNIYDIAQNASQLNEFREFVQMTKSVLLQKQS